ncbi:MAG: DUF4349 domain-containing protein [Anaerolineaceae bacterium]|nr:DUF4349 domain-containing protein [Anaerolineaceae bacterium]
MKKIALIAIVLLISVTSCASASESYKSEPAMDYYMEEEMAMEAPASGSPVMDYDEGNSYELEQSVPDVVSNTGTVERVVLKDASLSIIVNDPAAAMSFITKLAEDSGGFVVNSNLYKTYTGQGIEVPEANITIRVPAVKLIDSLDRIKSLVENIETDIENESISGLDVTREYTDLSSRLTNLEQAEAQLQEIMDEAYKTEDVLAIFNQLTYISEQIEVIKGQLKYYEEASRLSSISIQVISAEKIAPITIGKWQPQGVARDAVQALINAFKFIVEAMIWIVIYVLPILLMIGAFLYLVFLFFRFIWRLLRRKNRKNKETKSIDTPKEVNKE